MRRTDANILREITMISTEGEDRYGAHLLGRAIGHEMAAEHRTGQPPAMFYSNLIHQTPHTATRKIMAFTAAREVQAL